MQATILPGPGGSSLIHLRGFALKPGGEQNSVSILDNHSRATAPGHSASLDPSETNGTLENSAPAPAREFPENDLNDKQWESCSDSVAESLPQPNLCQTFRHSGWKPQRRKVFASMVRTGQTDRRTTSFAQCGSHAYVLKSPEPPHRYKVAGSTCHDRLCTPCANTRSRIVAHNVLERIGKDRVRFLTLTVATDAMNLSEAIDHLTTSFTKLRKRKDWKLHVKGGVAFLEIKWNEPTQRWHPHLHCLTQGTFWHYKDVSNAWLQSSGDSPIVHITLVKDTRNVGSYVTKYACKPLNSSYLKDDSRLDEAILALKGRRLATTFGRWRGIALTDRSECEAWDNIGSLRDWIVSAAQGDAEGLAIMASLGGCHLVELLTADERAPPSPAVPAAPKTYRQDRFWDLYTIY